MMCGSSSVDLSVNRSGAVKVEPGSVTKAYPSVEGYSYQIVGGDLSITNLFKNPEQTPDKLKGSMDQPLGVKP